MNSIESKRKRLYKGYSKDFKDLDKDKDAVNEPKGAYANLKIKMSELYLKGLIGSQNKKLKFFHLLVSITLFYDFYLTGFILANYRFLIGKTPNFMSHRISYIYISTIQAIDIVLNFFKLDSTKQPNRNVSMIFVNYLRGNFLTDCIAVVPYSLFLPQFIFLRYLKLLKFNTYLSYIEDLITEYLLLIMNG